MTHNWERIQSLFLQALDLAPAERASFLQAACADDTELRSEVESLIAHDGVTEQQISEALEDTALSLFESENVAGTRLGVWRVLQEIGRGGMGTVYLASRDDDQFQKKVAIKVVKRGMDTAELLNRFRRERQILAHLDHPYIARLIDAGNTPQGQPFLVMEYVQGRPIDVYCRQDGLSVGKRCRLFLKVCEAVSYAHRNLVIHRDLKPSNILVATDGSPKLLDFGVAKLLDTELDSGQTVAAGRMLTPDYASPEQVRGGLVSAATDIYALGAILYELLTGVKAQQIDSHSPSALERAICETEVEAPSARVGSSNQRLRKRLSGDLDNIILMAMRKEPEHRYSSVDLFAKDVGRHLKGRTVSARRPSWRYSFSKFARRNRFGLATAALLGISLIAGTWVALVQAHHARIEQRRAEARLSQMVELANRALFDVHGNIERLPGATEARKQLVNTTLDYLEKLSKDAGNDERLSKALGAAYFRLGDLQGYPFTPNLGDSMGAIKSYRAGVALLGPLRQAHPKDSEAQRLWLETEGRLATLLDQTGDSQGAAKLLRDALPWTAALARLPGSGVDAERIEGEFYDLLAVAVAKQDLIEALADARRYLEIFTGLARRFPDREDLRLKQSDGHELMGQLLHFQGDTHAALDHHLRCVALREALVKAHPNDVVYKRNLMIGYGHVGDMLGSPIAHSLGDSDGARIYYRKAVAMGEEIHNADPRDSTAKFDLAAGLERLGMVDVPASNLAESLAVLVRSATILESIAADDPNSLRVKRMLALVDEYAGHRLRSLVRYREAITSYHRSITLSDEMLVANPADLPGLSQLIASGRGLATAMAMAGNRTGALKQAEATIARAKSGLDAGPEKRNRQRYLAESVIELGSIYEILAKRLPPDRQSHDWEAARSTLRRAVSLMDSTMAGLKPLSLETSNRQNALNLLADAEAHLSASAVGNP